MDNWSRNNVQQETEEISNTNLKKFEALIAVNNEILLKYDQRIQSVENSVQILVGVAGLRPQDI